MVKEKKSIKTTKQCTDANNSVTLYMNVEAKSKISQQKNGRFKKNSYNYMHVHYMIALKKTHKKKLSTPKH